MNLEDRFSPEFRDLPEDIKETLLYLWENEMATCELNEHGEEVWELNDKGTAFLTKILGH